MTKIRLSPYIMALLIQITMLVLISSAQAQQSNGKITLKVKDAWLSDLETRKPIWVQVENLQTWIRQPGNDVSKFILCLGGIPFNFPPILGHDDWLSFQTDSPAEFKSMWKTLLNGSTDKSNQMVALTLIYDKMPVEGVAIKTVTHNRSVLTVFVIMILGTILLFLLLAHFTDIVREPGATPDDKSLRKKYSLARTQMACWFFVVIFSYVFIWYLTGSLDVLTGSVLALIGISSATALSSAIVDSKNSANAIERNSTNFLMDVLSDDGGISFHRFQIFAWTIVLSIIFISTVWCNLSMPDFDPALLALMGISGGTYVGFKLPKPQG